MEQQMIQDLADTLQDMVDTFGASREKLSRHKRKVLDQAEEVLAAASWVVANPELKIPQGNIGSTAHYVAEFERLNGLRSTTRKDEEKAA